MGASGMFTLDTGNGPEVYCSASLDTTDEDYTLRTNFWYVLSWLEPNVQLETTYVSAPLPAEPAAGAPQGPYEHFISFAPAQVTGDAVPEIVTCSIHGKVIVYDAKTRQPVRTVRTRTALEPGEVTQFIAVDLTGDGIAEFITLSGGNRFTVHDAAGNLLWEDTNWSYGQVAVGQFDTDAALELATVSGSVIDTVTHAVEWTRPGSINHHWYDIKAADLNGDGIDEILAANWDSGSEGVDAVSVSGSSLLWHIDIGAGNSVTKILAENIDNDAGMELVLGTFTGPLSVYSVDAAGCTPKWSKPVAGWGVSGLLAAQTPFEGLRSLLWYPYRPSLVPTEYQALFSANTYEPQFSFGTTGLGNKLLDGPFLPPVIGDVTGDGVPEILTASTTTKGGRYGGSIVVLDATTRRPISVSFPLFKRIEDLQLRDLDGDGLKEIVVTLTDQEAYSSIYAYKYNNQYSVPAFYRSATSPIDGNLYTQTEVADADGDGDLEYISVNRMAVERPGTGYPTGTGNYLTITDATTGAIAWRSGILSTGAAGFTCLAVADVDGDGNLEAVFGGEGAGLFVVDLKTHAVELNASNVSVRSVAVDADSQSFLVGTSGGQLIRYNASAANTYAAGAAVAVSDQPVTGLLPGTESGLWITSGGRFQYWPDDNGPTWSAEDRATQVDGPPALLWTEAGMEAYVGYGYGISSFVPDGTAIGILPNVGVSVNGTMTEGTTDSAVIEVVRDLPGENDLAVKFRLTGTATASDVTFTNATDLGDGVWSITIPAGQLSATATARAADDQYGETEETFAVTLEASTGYSVTLPGTAGTIIADNDVTLTLTPLLASVEETTDRDAPDAGWVLSRTGDLTKALRVTVQVGGTATAGKDYRKLAATFTIPARKSSVVIPLVPLTDAIVEPMETVALTVLPGANYGAAEGQATSTVQLIDVSSTVSLDAPLVTPTGVDVTFRRTDGLIKPLAVTFIETKTTNGRPVQVRRRVTFRAGEDTAVYSVREGAKAFSDEIVLEADESYTSGATTTVSFDVAAR